MSKNMLAYYNFDKVMSYNAIFSFIIGGRGLGKTFGAKKKAIQKFIKTGEEFIYLRRWKTELVSKDTFFDDLIVQNVFPEWDFQINGRYGMIAPRSTRDDKKRPWKRMCYFIALSTAQHQKSISYPLVKTIIFDEFIIEKSNIQYIRNEVKALEGFYLTVDRNTDKTRIQFLANSVSIINPYFIEYSIEPQDGQELMVLDDGAIVVHIPESLEFQKDVYKTRFGKFLAGKEHAEYAVGNKFSDNHDSMLAVKNEKARYVYTLESRSGIITVWMDDGKYHIQEKRPKSERLFTLDPIKMMEGKTLIETRDKLIQNLRTAYRNERMTFDTAKTRNIFIEVFRK